MIWCPNVPSEPHATPPPPAKFSPVAGRERVSAPLDLDLRDDTVLFLDVDGVLNNRRVFLDRRFAPFPLDHLCVQRLQSVVQATRCRIVLSSAWREMPMLEAKLAGDLVFLGHNGWDPISTRHEDRSTKRLDGRRGAEIAEWLSRHPEVTQFAIVDDETDMLPEQMPFLVQTDFEHGLTKRGARQLIAILRLRPTEGEVA